MDADSFEAYLTSIGFRVEQLQGLDGLSYTVVRDFVIPSGALEGRTCDVALLRVDTVPYAVPAAIHTRPALLPMSGGAPLGTQPSAIDPSEWQYWSRRFDHAPTPPRVWAHVLTVLTDPSWPTT